MKRKLQEFIPEIMQAYLPEFFSTLNKNVETEADCENCSKCLVPGHKVDEKNNPENVTKCCNFYPSLPNFLLGAIIADPGMEPAARFILDRIDHKEGVTPFGIYPDEKYLQAVKNYRENDEFQENITCPLYDRQSLSCGIWKYRSSSCSAFFCKSVDGLHGLNFWTEITQYLGNLEFSISRFCVSTLIGENGFKSSEDSHDFYHKLWGSWAGQEREFYLECLRIFKSHDRDSFQKKMGSQLEL